MFQRQFRHICPPVRIGQEDRGERRGEEATFRNGRVNQTEVVSTDAEMGLGMTNKTRGCA